jgi:hypothetical protein
MDKKNLRPQLAPTVSHINIQDLATEMVELSEETLSQVWGGNDVLYLIPYSPPIIRPIKPIPIKPTPIDPFQILDGF